MQMILKRVLFLEIFFNKFDTSCMGNIKDMYVVMKWTLFK